MSFNYVVSMVRGKFMKNYKNYIHYVVVLLFIPLIIYAGVNVFSDRSYLFIATAITILAVISMLLTFEKNESSTRKLVVIAVLIAVTVVGRFLFAALPAFKPVTAIVVISAMFFGAEAGFLVGSLSAFISNIYFGQGPWTPFQMFSWGFIGFIAGIPYISAKLRQSKIYLTLYGLFAGVIYSLLMDIWTVMSMDGYFNVERYIAAIGLSLPFMAVYAISNVIFLWLTVKPIGEKLERLKKKYNI